MAHNIMEMDLAARPDWAEPAWHEAETLKSGKLVIIGGDITTPDQIPEIACPVVLEKVILPAGYVMGGNRCSHWIVAKRPNGDSVVVHSASPEYVPNSNAAIFETVMEAFQKHGIPAKCTFALTMGNLSKVSFSFEVEGASEFFVGTGDKHKLILNALGSNDKSMGTRIFGSGIRVVCANTFAFALRSAKEVIDATFYHNSTGKANFDRLPELLEACLLHAKEYSALAEKMGNRPLKLWECRAIAAQMLANGSKEISTQVYNQAHAIGDLFERGKGNHGETLLDFFNGVTEYFTSGEGTGKKATGLKKQISADYGTGMEKKGKILANLQDEAGELLSDSELNSLISEGMRLLKDRELVLAGA